VAVPPPFVGRLLEVYFASLVHLESTPATPSQRPEPALHVAVARVDLVVPRSTLDLRDVEPRHGEPRTRFVARTARTWVRDTQDTRCARVALNPAPTSLHGCVLAGVASVTSFAARHFVVSHSMHRTACSYAARMARSRSALTVRSHHRASRARPRAASARSRTARALLRFASTHSLDDRDELFDFAIVQHDLNPRGHHHEVVREKELLILHAPTAKEERDTCDVREIQVWP
jgi:hypothetical protein